MCWNVRKTDRPDWHVCIRECVCAPVCAVRHVSKAYCFIFRIRKRKSCVLDTELLWPQPDLLRKLASYTITFQLLFQWLVHKRANAYTHTHTHSQISKACSRFGLEGRSKLLWLYFFLVWHVVKVRRKARHPLIACPLKTFHQTRSRRPKTPKDVGEPQLIVRPKWCKKQAVSYSEDESEFLSAGLYTQKNELLSRYHTP